MKKPKKSKVKVERERWRERRGKRLSQEGVGIRFPVMCVRNLVPWMSCKVLGILVVSLYVCLVDFRCVCVLGRSPRVLVVIGVLVSPLSVGVLGVDSPSDLEF